MITSKFGILLPRIESKMKFRSPCKQGDEVEVEIAYSQIRKRSFEGEFRITNISTGKVAVEGSIVTVATPLNLEKSVDLPPEFISKIERYSKPSA